jgi:hypothetical protein
MTRLNLTDARCEALFASGLQRSDTPDAEMVAEVISHTVRQLGTRGCASRMAQEFGDHPKAAAERMRWIRQLAAETAAPATCEPGPETAWPIPGARRPPGHDSAKAGSPATTADQRNQHGRNKTQ